jgi:tetratricopeptide (TPR) repeat protein
VYQFTGAGEGSGLQAKSTLDSGNPGKSGGAMKSRLARWGRGLVPAAFGILGCLVAGSATAIDQIHLKNVNAALQKDDLNAAQPLVEELLQKNVNDVDLIVLLGEIHWRRGELQLAAQRFEAGRSADAKDARPLAGLAMVAMSQDDFETATTLAEQAMGLDKKEWLARYAMGRALLERGQTEEAYKLFEKGKDLKKRVDRRDLFEAGMGLLALAENDADGAETSLIRARGLAPNTVEHVMNLAEMYEANNSWGRAATVLEDMSQKLGSSPQLSYRLGVAYENLRRWNDALRQYQATLEADSTYAPAMAGIGHLLLLDTSKTAHAVSFLSRAVAIRATPQSQLDLGIGLTRLPGRAVEAIPHLEASLAAQETPQTKLALARAYLKAGQDDKGKELFEGDVDVRLEAPADDLALVAAAFVRGKDFETAGRYLDLATEKDPDNVEVAYRRGLIQLYEKNYVAAISYFETKLKADPTSALAWMNMAIAQQGNDNAAMAAAAYSKVTQQAPNSGAAWTQYGAVLVELGKNADASQAYSRAIQLDGSNGAAWRGRGYLNLLEKKYPEAIRDLRQASKLDPSDTFAWVALGQALLNAGGRLDEAETAFQKAIRLDPANESAQEGLNIIKDAR